MTDTNKTNRINIAIPRDWAEAFREAASKSSQTLSEWLRECGKANLHASVQKRLSEPRSVGRAKKDT